jgi:hypothetical protein
MGAKYSIYTNGEAFQLKADPGASYILNDSNFKLDKMAGTVASDINTFAFRCVMPSGSVTTTNASILVNGKSYVSGDYTAGSFHSQFGTASFNGADLDVFAIRAYTRALSAEETLQNHFADIALILKLDVTAFLELDEAGKLEVYKAFETKSASDGREAMQALLDEAVAQ